MNSIFRTALSGVTSIFSGWQGYLIAAGLAAALASAGTWRVMSWREQAHQTQIAVHTVEVVKAQDKVTMSFETNFLNVKAVDTAGMEKRLSEILAHVTPEDDARCTVPLGFVRVWNDAAHGPVPDAAAGPDDAPSGVALSDIAKTGTVSLGQYDSVSHQLTALQDWVLAQQALADKK